MRLRVTRVRIPGRYFYTCADGVQEKVDPRVIPPFSRRVRCMPIHEEPLWVCIDTETTGLRRSSDQLIQFAAYAHTDEGFVSYVHTDRVISPEITMLTGVRQEHVAHAPDILAVWAAFGRWLSVQKLRSGRSSAPVVLVAHNATFDIDILLYALARSGMHARDAMGGLIEGERVELFVDTLTLSRRVFPKPTVANHKLGTLYRHCTGSDLDGAHDALVDVKGLYAVFERIIPSLPRSAYRRIDGRWDRWQLDGIANAAAAVAVVAQPPTSPASPAPPCDGPTVSPYFDGVSKPPFKHMRIQFAASMHV